MLAHILFCLLAKIFLNGKNWPTMLLALSEQSEAKSFLKIRLNPPNNLVKRMVQSLKYFFPRKNDYQKVYLKHKYRCQVLTKLDPFWRGTGFASRDIPDYPGYIHVSLFQTSWDWGWFTAWRLFGVFLICVYLSVFLSQRKKKPDRHKEIHTHYFYLTSSYLWGLTTFKYLCDI